MAINYSEKKLHWTYFLALERDFETITRYIEPSEANNETFSIELARLIMSATQEVDVVLKRFCKLLDHSASPEKIGQYHPIVKRSFPDFFSLRIIAPRFGMDGKPWIDWKPSKAPEWVERQQ